MYTCSLEASRRYFTHIFVDTCTSRLFGTLNVAFVVVHVGELVRAQETKRNPPRGKGRNLEDQRRRQGTKYVGVNRMGGGACWVGGRSESE